MKYVSVSGGADSTAVALLMWERGEDFEMVFADTGAELPETYWLLPRLAEKVGKPLHVVSDGGFFKFLAAQKFMLPGPRVRWCTRLLKMCPIDYWLAGKDEREVCVGIRADEPRRLKKITTYAGKHEAVHPLAEAGMGKDDVKALCRKHDLLSPVYKWRTNVSCFCCFFQRKADWLGMLQHHPTLYSIAETWEKHSLLTSRKKYTWMKDWSLEDLRKADQRQLRLFPEPEGEPCMICQW